MAAKVLLSVFYYMFILNKKNKKKLFKTLVFFWDSTIAPVGEVCLLVATESVMWFDFSPNLLLLKSNQGETLRGHHSGSSFSISSYPFHPLSH